MDRTCPLCMADSSVEVDEQAFKQWTSGALVQTVWPNHSPEWRERVISGTHAECWDRLFGDPE